MQPPRDRVLVVDDDEPLAASLRRSLEYAGYDVTVAGDGPNALAAAARTRPAVVVLDVQLPGIDGYGVCRALRVAPGAESTMILMLTARDAPADRVTGLDAGADDYLVKPFDSHELLARVRALLRRRPTPPEESNGEQGPDSPTVRVAPVRLVGDLVVDPGTREVHRGPRAVELTALEFDLLHHFARHPRQVFTRQQLLDAVWGGGNAATSNVVDVYVGYLRSKLEAAGEPRLLHTVRGVGYVLKV
jgi:two-component system response regulator MprA